MVSVLALGVVDHGFELWSGQNKALKKMVFVASPLNMQN